MPSRFRQTVTRERRCSWREDSREAKSARAGIEIKETPTARLQESPPIYTPLTHSPRLDDNLRLAMKIIFTFVAVLALAVGRPSAQTITHSHPHPHLLASHIIVPQARTFATHSAGAVTITEVNVVVEILEQVATTTLDINLTNATSARLEAEMVVPVPEKAALRGFNFQGAARDRPIER